MLCGVGQRGAGRRRAERCREAPCGGCSRCGKRFRRLKFETAIAVEPCALGLARQAVRSLQVSCTRAQQSVWHDDCVGWGGAWGRLRVCSRCTWGVCRRPWIGLLAVQLLQIGHGWTRSRCRWVWRRLIMGLERYAGSAQWLWGRGFTREWICKVCREHTATVRGRIHA